MNSKNSKRETIDIIVDEIWDCYHDKNIDMTFLHQFVESRVDSDNNFDTLPLREVLNNSEIKLRAKVFMDKGAC